MVEGEREGEWMGWGESGWDEGRVGGMRGEWVGWGESEWGREWAGYGVGGVEGEGREKHLHVHTTD